MASSAGIEVHETGRAVRFQTESPHLVSTGSGRLSTAVTLHPLPEGRVILGSDRNADIPIIGTGVEPVHCAIENNNGVVVVHPLNGSTSIDGTFINTPFKLAQGCMLSIGRSNYMRFNNPAEAKLLKSVLPNTRISMAPISFNIPAEFNDESTARNLERKPPVGPSRKSPRNSYTDDPDVGFLGKITKFEMLARQCNKNSVSPKVFPLGALTTSVPAEQILGRSRSSSLVSLTKNHHNQNNHHHHHQSPLQNLTNFETTRSNGQSQTNNSLATGNNSEDSARRINNENDGTRTSSNEEKNYYDHQMTRSLSFKQKSCERDKFSREFDMSQSLILAKTTTTEFLRLDNFSSSSINADASTAASSNRSSNNFPEISESTTNLDCHTSTRTIQAPSPAFNRNPRYSETKRRDNYYCATGVTSPSPSNASGCSLEELNERQQDAENRRRDAEKKRKIEQEIEKQEKLRLEEILAMCAEYERQNTPERPRQPNRIKTNGSLPRDKRPAYQSSPFGSPKSPAANGQQRCFSFDATTNANSSRSTSRENVCSRNYEKNVETSDGANNNFNEIIESSSATTNNNNNNNNKNDKNSNENGQRANNWTENDGTETAGFSASVSQARCQQTYDSPMDSPLNGKFKIDRAQGETSFGAIQLNGTRIDSTRNYENFVPTNGNFRDNCAKNDAPLLHRQEKQQRRNNNENHDCGVVRSNLSNSCEIIENKLAISNDDLLEAIQQLSILASAKSKDSSVGIAATPKRNNTEMDNEKSNEAKADKERRELEAEDRRKYIEFLENEKLHIFGNMDVLKRSIADIEVQEEEINRELELEKALLSAEYDSESLELTSDEGEKIRTQMRINELEREMSEDNSSQANLQTEAKNRVQRAQRVCNRLEEEIEACDDEQGAPRRREIMKKLIVQQDILESERKAFEDLEFHHLEEEASKLVTREELQRHLSELSARIEERKIQLNNLEAQRSTMKNSATKDRRSLERQKLGHMRRLEEGRSRLRAIEDELEYLMRNPVVNSLRNPAESNSEEKRSPSREDFDRISRVTTDSPIVNHQGSLGRKTMESLKEIERNRQLHLAKQGSQVISEERRRVEELKRRVQDEVRSQWEERKMNCASFNSVESGEESSSYSTGPTESGSGSSDGAEVGANGEKILSGKHDEFASSSPGPSSNNSYTLLHGDNMRDDRVTSMEAGERLSARSVVTIDENESRPLSQTSSEMDSVDALQPVQHRDKPKLQRPLTRYLPIKSDSLDLRNHIETAGHHLQLVPDVTVDTTTCSGYLSKMSKKFHHWNKRWFVFDRKRKTLSYYSDDNTTRKARGLIYFQSIEEVYVDHMNTVRSPQPSLTFIMKTKTRLYYLMAPSPEAMRIWVDVVFTGAEGYHEFDHGA